MSKGRLIFGWCVILLFCCSFSALAQKKLPLAKSPEVKNESQPVVFGDKVLFSIGSIEKFSAERRAKEIEERIKRIAEDSAIPNTVATSNFNEPFTQIVVGDKFVMTLVDRDARTEGLTREELARDYAQKLQTAIENYRDQYRLKKILMGALYSLMATLILLAALYLIRRFFRKIGTRIKAWEDSKKGSLHIQSVEIIRVERLHEILGFSLKLFRFAILIGIFYLYSHLVLSLFPWTRPFADTILEYAILPFNTIGNAVWGYVPNFFFLAILILITFYVLRLLRFFFRELEKGTLTFKGFLPEWAEQTYKIFRLLIVAFAVVVAFPYIPGSSSPAFKGISIFFGVLFSLGSTSAIANIVAGYTLTYRRVFKVGDRVKIADFMGDVTETRLQVTQLRTIKNEEIVVPNSMIVNSHVINYSTLAKEAGLILHTSITIGYDTPWRQVEAMLLMAAERTKGILPQPAPFVLQTSLDDFYVSYELNVTIDSPQAMTGIYSDLHRNIQDAFNEYGVQIMSPSYRSDPEEPKIVPKEQWYAPPAKPTDSEGKGR
jgi:small-conductance mechanosensitive channel